MKTADIRSRFLEFFRQRGHRIVPSATLVPASDPTLLFTNSGMVQFKNVFLGSEKPGYVRAADVQRCLRAGGKHNDLDQVGYTARHHTFFEMLGNWSFGDYFKREAIAWAWELLTAEFGLPPEKLWITVYHTDDEAYRIWNETIGVPAGRIVRIGDNKGAPYASDNFWQMADTGPCGPCTEIFYDHGPDVAGGPPGSTDADGDRYIEIWNLVFMQFDRQPDGTLAPLPAPCVDTGMGLERLAAVLQHKRSNYEIDLFQHLVRTAAELTATNDPENKSLRVIADHIRACAFLIVDGVLPSNEGRGYVLRRIIRRALRHGWMLGVRGDFFWKMVAPLVAEMGSAYPELAHKQTAVEQALRTEEQRFGETLEHGMRLFDDVAARAAAGVITGADAFRLYDTYGFPVDLTADIARERGLGVDMTGFEQAMNAQRERARAASQFEAKGQLPAEMVSTLTPTVFMGYETLADGACAVLGIVREGVALQQLAPGETGIVILDRTPFYAESGGQVGDTGALDGPAGRFDVADTRKLGGAYHGHAGHWQGSAPLRVGDSVRATVDAARRQAIVLNHSATHLLHSALRAVLGTHVQQKGSLVAPERLRFDFSHGAPLTTAEKADVEARVNAAVRANHAAEVHRMGYQQALDFGAIALFGEKYGDEVRVLRMGEVSTELCGGTHVARTGDIGSLRVLGQGAVAAGVRRIEATTGLGALALGQRQSGELAELAGVLKTPQEELSRRAAQLLEQLRAQDKELATLKSRAAAARGLELAGQAREIAGVRVLAARLDGADAATLRALVDQLKARLKSAAVLLASVDGDKVQLAAGVSADLVGRLKAGELVNVAAQEVGGKGGGRPDFAMAGGNRVQGVDAALDAAGRWIEQRLAAAGA